MNDQFYCCHCNTKRFDSTVICVDCYNLLMQTSCHTPTDVPDPAVPASAWLDAATIVYQFAHKGEGLVREALEAVAVHLATLARVRPELREVAVMNARKMKT